MKTNSRMIVLLMTMVSTSFVHGQTNLLPNGDFSDTLALGASLQIEILSRDLRHFERRRKVDSSFSLAYDSRTTVGASRSDALAVRAN